MKQQLEAAGIAYYAALTKAYLSMDEKPLASLRTATCTCQKVEVAIREARGEGSRVQLIYEIVGASAHDVYGSSAGVTLNYRTSLQTMTDVNGKEISRTPAVKRGIKEIYFKRQNGRWLVDAIETYT